MSKQFLLSGNVKFPLQWHQLRRRKVHEIAKISYVRRQWRQRREWEGHFPPPFFRGGRSKDHLSPPLPIFQGIFHDDMNS